MNAPCVSNFASGSPVIPAGVGDVGVVGSVCVRDSSDAAEGEEIFPRAPW